MLYYRKDIEDSIQNKQCDILLPAEDWFINNPPQFQFSFYVRGKDQLQSIVLTTEKGIAFFLKKIGEVEKVKTVKGRVVMWERIWDADVLGRPFSCLKIKRLSQVRFDRQQVLRIAAMYELFESLRGKLINMYETINPFNKTA